jgi:hypothetical protein
MKWLSVALLGLALVACAESGNFSEKPTELAASIEQIAPPTKSIQLVPRPAAAKPHADERSNISSLIDCVSDACKIQCSPRVENRSRPKWCAYFKEPIDRHAAGDTSEIERKSTE